MVLMAIWGCCRRRGHSPRLGLGMALATIGTAAAFTDTTLAAIRRHRGGPRMVAAGCAGFRAGCRIGGAGDGADRAAEMALKRFPSDLNRWDSQEVKDGRVFVH